MLCYRSVCVFIALFVFGEAQFWRRQSPPCTTPTNEQGLCIALEECRVIATLANRPGGATTQERQYIQNSQCGRNSQSRYPNVCCPNNRRPIVFMNDADARPLTGDPAPPQNQPRPNNGNQPRPNWNQGRPGTGNQARPGNGNQIPTGNGNQVRPVNGNQGRPVNGNQGANNRNIAQPKNAALLAEDECGTTDQEVANRVLGGEEVSLGQFPWMALVQYSRAGKLSYRCGGVLISKRYVLSAAHCALPGNRYTAVAVRLGEHDKTAGTESQDCEGGVCSDPVVDVAIEQQVVHPGYKASDTNQYNDIALFRLARDIRFTRYVKPICLPHQDNLRTKDYRSQSLTISGWGRTEDDSGNAILASSDVLKKASQPVVESSRCVQAWTGTRVVNPEMQICAGGVTGRDACRGDSGGPLMSAEKVARDRTLRFHVIGVVSYGEECTLTERNRDLLPGVYTKVSFFVDWILDQLRA